MNENEDNTERCISVLNQQISGSNNKKSIASFEELIYCSNIENDSIYAHIGEHLLHHIDELGETTAIDFLKSKKHIDYIELNQKLHLGFFNFNTNLNQDYYSDRFKDLSEFMKSKISPLIREEYIQNSTSIKKETPPEKCILTDSEFVQNEILDGKFTFNINNYDIDTFLNWICYPIVYDKSKILNNFEKPLMVGDINNDDIDDWVFVLPRVNHCEEGDAYYFSSPEIPRLKTDSQCCHPRSIFPLGDIDGDGGIEIGEYYSSCASRFKSISLWTLKNGKWLLINNISFTLNDEFKAFDDFEKLVRKKPNGKHEILEIYDYKLGGGNQKRWVDIDMSHIHGLNK